MTTKTHKRRINRYLQTKALMKSRKPSPRQIRKIASSKNLYASTRHRTESLIRKFTDKIVKNPKIPDDIGKKIRALSQAILSIPQSSSPQLG